MVLFDCRTTRHHCALQAAYSSACRETQGSQAMPCTSPARLSACLHSASSSLMQALAWHMRGDGSQRWATQHCEDPSNLLCLLMLRPSTNLHRHVRCASQPLACLVP